MSGECDECGEHALDCLCKENVDQKMPIWHQMIQIAIYEVGIIHCLNAKDILTFLTATLCGQFALAGLSEEKVKATLDRMFDSYKRIKERMENESVTK